MLVWISMSYSVDSKGRWSFGEGQLNVIETLHVGCWEAMGVEEQACFGVFFCFLDYLMAYRGSRIERHFLLNLTTAATSKSLLSPLSVMSI